MTYLSSADSLSTVSKTIKKKFEHKTLRCLKAILLRCIPFNVEHKKKNNKNLAILSLFTRIIQGIQFIYDQLYIRTNIYSYNVIPSLEV